MCIVIVGTTAPEARNRNLVERLSRTHTPTGSQASIPSIPTKVRSILVRRAANQRVRECHVVLPRETTSVQRTPPLLHFVKPETLLLTILGKVRASFPMLKDLRLLGVSFTEAEIKERVDAATREREAVLKEGTGTGH